MSNVVLIAAAVLCVPFVISAMRQYARGGRWVKGERFGPRAAVATFLQLMVGLGVAVLVIFLPAPVGKYLLLALLVVFAFRRVRGAFGRTRS